MRCCVALCRGIAFGMRQNRVNPPITDRVNFRSGARHPYWDDGQSVVFPKALDFFHLARARAASLARPASEIFRFGFAGAAVPVPLILAQRARAAAAIAARPAADIFRFFGEAGAPLDSAVPRSRLSSFCNERTFSWMFAARRNCCGVRLVMEFIPAQFQKVMNTSSY